MEINIERHSLSADLLKTFVITFLLFVLSAIILTYLEKPISFFSDFRLDGSGLNMFVLLFTTILGVLVTILTILYTFENNLTENKALKILVARGKKSELYQRFNDSIFGLFGVIVLLSVMYIVKFSNNSNHIISSIYFFSTIFLIIFGFLRTYRCFILFNKFLKAIQRFEG